MSLERPHEYQDNFRIQNGTEKCRGRLQQYLFIAATDIARSGATNIPDLLAWSPDSTSRRLTANTWAISARGLNGRFSNELPGDG